MRRRVLLVSMAIGVGLMFSGCAEMDSINNKLFSFSQHVKAVNETLEGHNKDAFSKETDNLKPWKIKKISETHYVLDPFFAILDVKTRAEAEAKAKKLLAGVKDHWKVFGLSQTVQSDGCSITKTWTKGGGIDTSFYYSFKKHRCKSEIILSNGKLIGSYEYIQLKVLNLKGKWYLVVNHTNAKNIGFFAILKDTFMKYGQSNGVPGYIEVTNNPEVSTMIGTFANKIIKINNWSNDFVDVNLDSKDPRAAEYRDWYAKYMKKALK